MRVDLVATLLLLYVGRLTMGFDLALQLPSKYCVMERVKRMLGYNCSDLKLKEVPQYLKSAVEILVMTENRIRDLTIESFSKYTDLRYLYLQDNMVQTIERGTFSQLKYLEVVDLSMNALTTIPGDLFFMSHLRTLYIADNNLVFLKADLEVNMAVRFICRGSPDHRSIYFQNLGRPITAPLQIISLANCKLDAIPEFGLMPNLLHANFSGNDLKQLHTDQLAAMCNLKTIDLSNSRMPGCTCHAVRSYLASSSVFIKNGPNHCDIPSASCSTALSNTTQLLYSQCLASKAALVQEERQSSILIYAAIGIGCVIVLMLLMCCCIRNRKIARRKKEAQKAAAARRKARKAKAALEERLISSTQSSTNESDGCEKKVKPPLGNIELDSSKVIRVEIEKAPPD